MLVRWLSFVFVTLLMPSRNGWLNPANFFMLYQRANDAVRNLKASVPVKVEEKIAESTRLNIPLLQKRYYKRKLRNQPVPKVEFHPKGFPTKMFIISPSYPYNLGKSLKAGLKEINDNRLHVTLLC